MLDLIEDLIEDLAQRVRRNVAVDDAGLRLLAYSSHFKDADPARLRQLVDKLVDADLRAFLNRSQMHAWRGLQRVPAVPELGLTLDRIAFPLRSRYELLGLMWVIDEPALTEEQIAAARATADEVQQLLGQRQESRNAVDVAAETQLGALFTPGASRRSTEAAALALQELGLFTGAQSYRTIVASIPDAVSAEFGESAAAIVRRAIGLATASRLRSSFAVAGTESECAIVLSARAALTARDAEQVVNEVVREVRKIDRRVAEGLVIGIGEAAETLPDAALSYEQGRVAVRLARARGEQLAQWAEHPLDAFFAAATVPQLPAHLIPRVLREAVAAQPAEAMAVIESYLDNGCNVIATAELLQVHRTTVYYRIRRFEETSGLSLASGTDRLLLHAWLRMRAVAAPLT